MEYEIYANFNIQNDFMHVDDDIVTSKFSADENIVELYRSLQNPNLYSSTIKITAKVI